MKTSPILTLLFAAIAIVTVPSLSAKDWPNWRGPNHDGSSDEKGLNFNWPKGGPKLLWQIEGCGRGYSSVAVADGKIYTLGKRKNGEQLSAFDEKSGKELWSTQFGTAGHSNGTPTVDGDLVYAIGKDGDLVCCKSSNGEKVWSKRFDKDFGGKMMSSWGYSESPVIDGDQLVCTPGAKDAMIVALNKKTGKEIWRSKVPDDLGSRGNDGAGYSSVVISEGAGVRQYVQLTGRGLISVRAKDGKFLWNYNRVANGTANIPTPIVTGDHVFASTGYGTGAALVKLSKNGGGVQAEEVYFLEARTLQNHHGGMVRVGNYLYTGHKHDEGFPICIDITTGDVVWGGDERGPGSGSAAITLADGRLIFRYQDGTVALIEATPEEYKLITSFKPAYQEAESWAHPVVANGHLLLREQDKLMCYDLSN